MDASCKRICTWPAMWHGRPLVLLELHGDVNLPASPITARQREHSLNAALREPMLLRSACSMEVEPVDTITHRHTATTQEMEMAGTADKGDEVQSPRGA